MIGIRSFVGSIVVRRDVRGGAPSQEKQASQLQHGRPEPLRREIADAVCNYVAQVQPARVGVGIRVFFIGIRSRAMDVAVSPISDVPEAGCVRRRDGRGHRRHQAMGESIPRAKLTLQSAHAFRYIAYYPFFAPVFVVAIAPADARTRRRVRGAGGGCGRPLVQTPVAAATRAIPRARCPLCGVSMMIMAFGAAVAVRDERPLVRHAHVQVSLSVGKLQVACCHSYFHLLLG